jgi:hypothetical protein
MLIVLYTNISIIIIINVMDAYYTLGKGLENVILRVV